MRLKRGNVYFTVGKAKATGYIKTPMSYMGMEKDIYKFRCLLTHILILIKDDMIHYCNTNSISEEVELCKELGVDMFVTVRPMLFTNESPALMLTDDSYVKLVPSVEALFLGYERMFKTLLEVNNKFKHIPMYMKIFNSKAYLKSLWTMRKVKKEMWELLYAF